MIETKPDRPLFEVVVPTSSPEERRLVSVATARTLIGSPESDDNVLELILDGISAAAATFCNLARSGTMPVTFGREALRATWAATTCERGPRIALPWRVPIASIAVTEAGVELTDAQFRHVGGGIIERLSDGVVADWAAGAIVVDYEAGWLVGVDASAYDGNADAPPADLVSLIVDQARMQYMGRKRDPGLRSEDIPGVWAGTFNVIGGDSIGTSGLLKSLEDALKRSGFWKPAFA